MRRWLLVLVALVTPGTASAEPLSLPALKATLKEACAVNTEIQSLVRTLAPASVPDDQRLTQLSAALARLDQLVGERNRLIGDLDSDRNDRNAERTADNAEGLRLHSGFEKSACKFGTWPGETIEQARVEHESLTTAADERADHERRRMVAASEPTEQTIEARLVEAFDSPQQMYAIAARGRFVFARRTIEPDDVNLLSRAVPRGEALLITATNGRRANQIVVTAVDSVRDFEVSRDDVSLSPIAGVRVMPLTPADLTVVVGDAVGGNEDLTTVYDAGAALYGPPRFLRLAPGSPKVEAFLTLRDKTIACYDAKMAKLDPDGRRGNYDVVVGGTRVESLNARYDRKVCRACDCKGLNAKQRALAKEILTPLQTKAFEAYVPVIERVTTLFAKRAGRDR